MSDEDEKSKDEKSKNETGGEEKTARSKLYRALIASELDYTDCCAAEETVQVFPRMVYVWSSADVLHVQELVYVYRQAHRVNREMEWAYTRESDDVMLARVRDTWGNN